MSRNIQTRSEVIVANNMLRQIATDCRLIILKKDNRYGLFLIENSRLVVADILNPDALIGSIYVARVNSVKKDISAAFVQYLPDKGESSEAFLKFSNIPDEYLPIHQGDLIPVRLIAASQKGKRASVTAKISNKNLPDNWKYKTAFTRLSKSENPLFSYIKAHFSKDEYSFVISDSIDVYNTLKDVDFYSNGEGDIKLFEDEKLSLEKLFSLKTKFSEAVSSKIYLKSGGYLIINFTEALTIIDVNSGKAINSKSTDRELAALNINKEAAMECALQMRLRGLSGMILIDFINMEQPENNDDLIEYMKECLKNSNIPTSVIDITPLGIMEITRQKKDRPLSEITDSLFDILTPVSGSV